MGQIYPFPGALPNSSSLLVIPGERLRPAVVQPTRRSPKLSG